jgi:uncharacterized protein (TIGR02996 family)
VKLWRAGKKIEYAHIELNGKTLAVTVAENYSQGKTTKKSFKTPAAAKAGLAEAIAAQRAKGFRELGEPEPTTLEVPRDAGLEAEIRKHRADPDAYLVYADWLQGQGSPFGEMIVFAHKKKQKQANAIAAQLGVPHPKMAAITWRNGFWQTIHLQNDIDWMEDIDILRFVRPIFASPLCAVLEELRIGILNWDDGEQPAVIAEAGKHAWAKDLARLRIGDVGDADVDMAHHAIGDVGKAITKHFPNLESLWLHSGDQSWSTSKESFGIAGLELPKLKDLTIETCAMSRKRMKSLTAAKLPALERLEVWFGDRERDANATVADVAPIWSGKLFPHLRHLGLCNSDLVLDFIRLLPDSKLAKQLVSLDLSKGTFGDDGVPELVEAAAKFPALTELCLDDSWLSPAGLKALKKALPRVKISAKDQQELLDPEEYGSDRYVSVGE